MYVYKQPYTCRDYHRNPRAHVQAPILYIGYYWVKWTKNMHTYDGINITIDFSCCCSHVSKVLNMHVHKYCWYKNLEDIITKWHVCWKASVVDYAFSGTQITSGANVQITPANMRLCIHVQISETADWYKTVVKMVSIYFQNFTSIWYYMIYATVAFSFIRNSTIIAYIRKHRRTHTHSRTHTWLYPPTPTNSSTCANV